MELMQILDFCAETKNIWILIGKIVRIVLIVIPIIIVLLGTFDLGKAVMAGEDKEPWRRRIDDCLQAFRDTNIDGITY